MSTFRNISFYGYLKNITARMEPQLLAQAQNFV